MRSDAMKSGLERAPHRGLMMATGIKAEDIKKPFIGVCNSYTNIVTWNWCISSALLTGRAPTKE